MVIGVCHAPCNQAALQTLAAPVRSDGGAGQLGQQSIGRHAQQGAGIVVRQQVVLQKAIGHQQIAGAGAKYMPTTL